MQMENYMMSYTTLGTNQCDKALAFYDVLFAIVAGSRLMDMDVRALRDIARRW